MGHPHFFRLNVDGPTPVHLGHIEPEQLHHACAKRHDVVLGAMGGHNACIARFHPIRIAQGT